MKVLALGTYILLALTSFALAAPAFADNCAGDSKTQAMKKNTGTIVDTARDAGSFTTLVSLLESTGLDKTLASEGPFTVFAPTDEAFSKVPAETLTALQNDKEQLKKVLTYHVVSGEVAAKDVVALNSAKTVEGSTVSISAEDGVTINNAKVVKTDIEADNGLIHVIDAVLIPNS